MLFGWKGSRWILKKHIFTFGTLELYFTIEGKFCYPNVLMSGPQGTTAELFGQHMSAFEIQKFGQALMAYADTRKKEEEDEKLRYLYGEIVQ